MEVKKEFNPQLGNRAYRRWYKKLTGLWYKGTQDDHKATHQQFSIPVERKSRNGIVYSYYKKIIDVIKK